MDNCLVTFFYDINRSSWNGGFSRNTNQYIESFKVMLNYDYNMIIFIDDRYIGEVESIINSSPYKHNKKLIPINEEWLTQNIWSWSKLSREIEIMNSDNYKKLVLHRINAHYPENINPMYTILTHSKIDFVNYVIDNNMTNNDIVGWVDFGYFHNKTNDNFLPKGVLDLTKFDLSKVNICLIKDIDERDKDIIYNLTKSPEKIGAYFFIGRKEGMKEFQNLSHKWLVEYQKMGIADDEQSLWLQCYFENPGLFKKHVFNRWHAALKHFSI